MAAKKKKPHAVDDWKRAQEILDAHGKRIEAIDALVTGACARVRCCSPDGTIGTMSNPFMTSAWSVRFELPRRDQFEHAKNLSATVIADTAERALEIIHQAHANARVYAVNHKGRDVTYVDQVILAETEYASPMSKCSRNRNGLSSHLPNDFGRCAYCAATLVMTSTPPAEIPEGVKVIRDSDGMEQCGACRRLFDPSTLAEGRCRQCRPTTTLPASPKR